jgi:hypothetical protein
MHGAHASPLGLGGSVLPHAIPFRGDGRESETVPCGPVPRYGGHAAAVGPGVGWLLGAARAPSLDCVTSREQFNLTRALCSDHHFIQYV